jgi:c-di-GMP-binding flagellar brake protein YcgR
MEQVEKITGKRILDILKELKEDRTLITLRLPDQDYEWLTVISDIGTRQKKAFLLIDCPDDFNQTYVGEKGLRMKVEFHGKDGLPYNFSASGAEIERNRIRLQFPEVIERYQRRRDFRLAVPPGIMLRFEDGSEAVEMTVVDISIGGAAVMKEKGLLRESLLTTGRKLKDIELVFPFDEEDKRIRIKMSLVVRSKPHPVTGQNHYAIHFTHIDRDEEKALIDVIYRYQRQLLRQRRHIKP